MNVIIFKSGNYTFFFKVCYYPWIIYNMEYTHPLVWDGKENVLTFFGDVRENVIL